MLRALFTALLCTCLATPAFAQAQAANAAFEGTITDSSGAVLPGVTVTITNVDTGDQRVVVSNERGLYRAPLLPLGAYRLAAELAGFKKFEQTGLSLSAGQAAVINITLGVGEVTEVVSVTADTPIVDSGKIDIGRNLNEREVKNLPLVSRNPYNLALLQPGVSGFENSEFGVPRFSANGTLLRINYQIDGNTNTQKDRAGLRLLPISEVMVREVKVVTSGYAPEFGQTTGLVYNAITPSGTNTLHGSGSYRFRRKDFSARPHFLNTPNIPVGQPFKPDTHVDTFTAEVGGPVVKDKVHYFFGFENTSRDLSAERPITINPQAAARLGLSAQESSGVIPAEQDARFFIGKVDYQVSQAHRLTGRHISFRNDSPNNIGGGTNSTQWSTDFLDSMDSTAAQLVSTFGATRLNEARVQFAHRHQSRDANDLSGTGPAISVAGAANFGGPFGSASDAGFDFKQNIWQAIDNFTWIAGDHSFKVGFDAQFVKDKRRTTQIQRYNFPTVDAYLAARSGANRFSYSTFQQLIGPRDFEMSTRLYSFFAQDDWRVTPEVKLLYGVRYDLYDYPSADPAAPSELSRDFPIDKNNIGPRVGVAWTLGGDRRTVLRASTGIMYDQPLLAAFENAVQQNGTRSVTISLGPAAAGAPAFPDVISGAAGITRPTQSIFAIDPDFKTMRTIQSNIQVDRALGNDFSAQIGFVYVKGYDLPVITNVNLINPTGQTGDGRPIFSTAVNAGTRRDPRFNQINLVQSIGDSTYKALTLQLTKRYARGLQFDITYALGKGEDNAPLTGTLSVQGDEGRSDPTNLDRDKGPNIMDTRHTFAGSIVASPSVESSNALVRALLNNNQIGLLLQLNSGLPQNIRSNRDLNGDSVLADRPNGVPRNAVYLPARYNADMRYSRFIPISGARRAEILAEFKNLFNNPQTSAFNNLRVIATDTRGTPLATIPSSGSDFPTAGRSGYEARQFQIGFKFHF